MCRLILARGRFDPAAVTAAAVSMSDGQTADHDGPITRHPNGWGAVWRDRGAPWGVRTHRDTRPMVDSAHESPLNGISTDFLAIHVRHATLARNHGVAFTHPLERLDGSMPWYFMHNGFLPTVHRLLGHAESEFDSAEYFQYVVPPGTTALAADQTFARLSAIPAGGNSGNAIAINPRRAYVIHWSPEPVRYIRYFTMHRLARPDRLIISSEPVPALAPLDEWEPIPANTLLDVSLDDGYEGAEQ